MSQPYADKNIFKRKDGPEFVETKHGDNKVFIHPNFGAYTARDLANIAGDYAADKGEEGQNAYEQARKMLESRDNRKVLEERMRGMPKGPAIQIIWTPQGDVAMHNGRSYKLKERVIPLYQNRRGEMKPL